MDAIRQRVGDILPHHDSPHEQAELKTIDTHSGQNDGQGTSDKIPLGDEKDSVEMNGISNSGYQSLNNIQGDSCASKSSSDRENSSADDTADESSAVLIPEVKVYKRRWYMILVFSMFSMIQCAVWNTWGPVSHPAMAVLGWQEHDIAMMANYGCIMIVVMMGFFMWLLVEKGIAILNIWILAATASMKYEVAETLGLRWAMILGTGLSAAGTLARCLTLNPPYAIPLMHIGAALNGMAGPLAQGGCTLMSVTWFPPGERITATSLGNAANYFGAGLSFLIGPVIVRDRASSDESNTTASPSDLLVMKKEIHDMLIAYAVLSGVIFVTTVAYFPAKPPLPPSASAAETNRPDTFLPGFLQLLGKGVYWQVALVYAVTLGIYGAWTSLIDVNLRPVGVSQTDAAWLGFYSILSGAVFAFITARFNDMFSRHVKTCMMILFCVAAVLFGWFAAIAQGLIPLSLVELYIAGIVGSGILCGTIPLLFEVSCELAYPVSEAIASGVQVLMFNLVGVIFLSMLFIPNIGLSWMNWLLFAAILLAIPAVGLYREQYVRLELDDATERRRTASVRAEENVKGNGELDGHESRLSAE